MHRKVSRLDGGRERHMPVTTGQRQFVGWGGVVAQGRTVNVNVNGNAHVNVHVNEIVDAKGKCE